MCPTRPAAVYKTFPAQRTEELQFSSRTPLYRIVADVLHALNMPASLPRGSRMADRFTIESLVHEGTQTAVYHAHDAVGDVDVALKLYSATSSVERIAQEIAILERVRCDKVVALLAHGRLPNGMPYLALQWIPGEDLAARLLRQPLSPAESLTVLHHTALALAELHSRDVVHLDIKPANILLRDGAIDSVVLADLGIARVAKASDRPAAPLDSLLLGTVNFIAPERARGDGCITPSADIFSLGCVLFECLTGKPPFAAETPNGVLARLLFDDPPTPRAQNTPLPSPVVTLLHAMLAKDPRQRPQQAMELLGRLASLDDAVLQDRAGAPSGGALTTVEQHLVTVIAAQHVTNSDVGDGTTREERLTAVRQLLSPFGARLEELAADTLVMTLRQGSAHEARDQAEQAARGALLLHDQFPHAHIAVVTGKKTSQARLQTGPTVDRALLLLSQWDSMRDGPSGEAPALLLDEVTAGLVETVLDVRGLDSGALAIFPEQPRTDRTRPLLGKPTPFIGRDHDIAALESTLASCVGEPMSRLVLICAEAGYGKSRLRHEFLQRIQRRSAPLTLMFGRADLMGLGAPFLLAASAVRSLCGLSETAPPDQQRAQLVAYVGTVVAAPHVERVAAFLGELVGTPFPISYCAQLAAAQQDPRTMNAQVTAAWLDLLGGELTRRPVLLVMEDIHWADALSIGLVQAALREFATRPFMALLLGRPEFEELFPSICAERSVWMMRLGKLSQRACDRLVRHMLAERGASDALVAQIAQQSAGCPLLLEELIRATASRQADPAMQTILALLHARLMQLSPEQRRVLRAASIFGEHFEFAGVQALLGEKDDAGAIQDQLEGLVANEFLERGRGEPERAAQRYSFRHELLRDAAYELLTASDQQLGHRLAAQYLAEGAHPEPRVLFEHYRRGGLLPQAAAQALIAAERALASSDLAGALETAQLGIDCGALGQLAGELRAIKTQAHFWRDEWEAALGLGPDVVSQLAAGSEAWCRTLAVLLPTTSLSGRAEIFMALGRRLTETDPQPAARPAYMQALSYLAISACLVGQRQMAEGILQIMQATVSVTDGVQRLLGLGLQCFAELVHARNFGRDAWRNYQLAAQATRLTTETGDYRTLLFVKGYLGISLAELGQHTQVDEIFEDALALAGRLQVPLLRLHVQVQQHRAMLMRQAGPLQGPWPAQLTAVAESSAHNALLGGQAQVNLAVLRNKQGLLAEALAAARQGMDLLNGIPTEYQRALANYVLALALLGRGDEAQPWLDRAIALLAEQPGGYAEPILHATLVSALSLLGHREKAARQLQAAMAVLTEWLASLPDEAARARFADIEYVRRLLQLARSSQG